MDRPRLLQRALWLSVISIVFSGLIGVTAAVVGVSTGSLSLLGFGLDAAIDSVASVVLVWRFRVELREPHRGERIEQVAEAVIGVVLLLIAIYLVVGAVGALASGAQPEATTARTVLLVVAVLALPPLALAKHRVARQLASRALRADSVLTGVAALLAGIGLVALVLSEVFGLTWADAVGALFVAAILAREGWIALELERSKYRLLF
ncbi:MAG TPA: cation transporter [Candidatus Limnocylindria bacterium]|jgi:divalent metal cation (Fe/Co/Zn/Cd) transporter